MKKIRTIGCIIKDNDESILISLVNTHYLSNFKMFEKVLRLLDNIMQKYDNNSTLPFYQNILKQCQENNLYLSPFQKYNDTYYYNDIEDIVINPMDVNITYYREGTIYLEKTQFITYFELSELQIIIDIRNKTLTLNKIPTTERIVDPLTEDDCNDYHKRLQMVSGINDFYRSSIQIPTPIHEPQSFDNFKSIFFDKKGYGEESLKKDTIYFYNDNHYFN